MARTKQTARPSIPRENDDLNPRIPAGGIKKPYTAPQYKCCGITKKGKQCSKGLKFEGFCKQHLDQKPGSEKKLVVASTSALGETRMKVVNVHEHDEIIKKSQIETDLDNLCEKLILFTKISKTWDEKSMIDWRDTLKSMVDDYSEVFEE